MDNTEQSIISFCSGYAGIELGLELAGLRHRTVAYVEIEAFACANLVAKMEEGKLVPAPIWTNLKTFPMERFRGRVHGITGGYPCQPFSVAGQRKGEVDPRHLWPYIRKAVDVIRPEWCFFENVEGHLSQGIVQVLADLEGMGYRVEAGIFSAEEVGAPHQRKRVFILAHAGRIGSQISQEQTAGVKQSSELANSKRVNGSASTERWNHDSEVRQASKELGDSTGKGFQGACKDQEQITLQNVERTSCKRWTARPGEPQYEWEEPRVVGDTELTGHQKRVQTETINSSSTAKREAKPPLGESAYGSMHRVDELRILGNGVVPQTAAKAWITLNNC